MSWDSSQTGDLGLGKGARGEGGRVGGRDGSMGFPWSARAGMAMVASRLGHSLSASSKLPPWGPSSGALPFGDSWGLGPFPGAEHNRIVRSGRQEHRPDLVLSTFS